jgi:uncharacterized protein with HEPN domain
LKTIWNIIVEAVVRATDYLSDIEDFEVFARDRRSQDAVVRNIEIIGEAVARINNVGPDFIALHPEIPWTKMRAMRNVMIHEYFFVDLRTVWNTVKNDLPRLKQQIYDLLMEVREARND